MKRIILHWTGGGYKPSALDVKHYHRLIDGAGFIHNGKWPISANAKPTGDDYAAHTRACNTGSIGVALCGMAGAAERPFNAGRAPITPVQVAALVRLCAALAKEYGIPVTRETILSHAEVQPTLKIWQRGKWDIAWLPGFPSPQDPVSVGDRIRALIAAAM